jgi:hypothetical protein
MNRYKVGRLFKRIAAVWGSKFVQMERGLRRKCDLMPTMGAVGSPTICVNNVMIGGVAERNA